MDGREGGSPRSRAALARETVAEGPLTGLPFLEVPSPKRLGGGPGPAPTVRGLVAWRKPGVYLSV